MTVSTPAKIILSGEHSVVYGAPAIGAPLGLFLRSKWGKRSDGAITLSFQGEEKVLSPSWKDLRARLPEWKERHLKFKSGEIGIREVLTRPEDLAALAMAVFEEKTGAVLSGLAVEIETDIPMSSGLGSSSALILNLLDGLAALSSAPIADKLSVAREIEDFQHGLSSGLDLALVEGRRPLVFIRGQGIVGEVKKVPKTLTLVHSGTPSVSTGQCVAQVRVRFGAESAIWEKFKACTLEMKKALESEDMITLRRCVSTNQALLEEIGVVPSRVRDFVAACAARGIAAKICGAGAVAGEGAGMLWALPEGEAQERDLQKIAADFGYRHGRYDVAF